jgi:hypothetical protein
MYEHTEAPDSFAAISLFSEPLIKWYGALALVSLRRNEPERVVESELLPQFLSPSLGDWVRIIRLASCPASNQASSTGVQELFGELSAKSPSAVRAASARVEDYLQSPLSKRSLLDFLEVCVAYRNKTRGHGAPSKRHQTEFAGVFLEAWEEFLESLERFYDLKLMFVERSENFGANALHSLRVCSGLNSIVLVEKMTLPKSLALSSRTVHVFSRSHTPLYELSPILVRHATKDAFYFLNSGRKALEYLCYDGDDAEYYRPEGYDDAVRAFFGEFNRSDQFYGGSDPQRDSLPAVDVDLPFGVLGDLSKSPWELLADAFGKPIRLARRLGTFFRPGQAPREKSYGSDEL